MNIAICCLIKDTPEYLIKSFIEHHRAIGIQDIYFVVDNGSKFVEFVKDEHIQYIPINTALVFRDEYNKKISTDTHKDFNQLITYNWFFKTYKDKYDWISFLDDDEHLYIDLNELEKYKEYTALYIPWKVYYNPSTKAIDKFEGFIPVKEEYMYDSFSFYCCKSIINTKKCSFLQNDHYADYSGVFPNFKNLIAYKLTDKNLYHNLISSEECKNIYIKHYYIRSFEDWIYRVFNRGDNYKIKLFNTETKIPNRGIKDYYCITIGDSVNIKKAIQDIEQLGRYDVIEKIKEDPIRYGFGLYWDIDYLNELNNSGLLEKLLSEYGTKIIEWYISTYLKT